MPTELEAIDAEIAKLRAQRKALLEAGRRDLEETLRTLDWAKGKPASYSVDRTAYCDRIEYQLHVRLSEDERRLLGLTPERGDIEVRGNHHLAVQNLSVRWEEKGACLFTCKAKLFANMLDEVAPKIDLDDDVPAEATILLAVARHMPGCRPVHCQHTFDCRVAKCKNPQLCWSEGRCLQL